MFDKRMARRTCLALSVILIAVSQAHGVEEYTSRARQGTASPDAHADAPPSAVGRDTLQQREGR